MARPMTGLLVKNSAIAFIGLLVLPALHAVQRNIKCASNVLVAAKPMNKVECNITKLVQVARLI